MKLIAITITNNVTAYGGVKILAEPWYLLL